jgi:3-deoxy-manno-octulosonate cytidylyltransferase (CMP-KDO synthetase)
MPYPRYAEGYQVFEHIGVYAHRKEFLLAYAKLKPTPLEHLDALVRSRAQGNHT